MSYSLELYWCRIFKVCIWGFRNWDNNISADIHFLTATHNIKIFDKYTLCLVIEEFRPRYVWVGHCAVEEETCFIVKNSKTIAVNLNDTNFNVFSYPVLNLFIHLFIYLFISIRCKLQESIIAPLFILLFKNMPSLMMQVNWYSDSETKTNEKDAGMGSVWISFNCHLLVSVCTRLFLVFFRIYPGNLNFFYIQQVSCFLEYKNYSVVKTAHFRLNCKHISRL